MSRTFKLSVIFFVSIAWIVVVRMLMTVLDLSSNWSSWLFSFLVQVVGLGVIPMLLYKQWTKGDIKKGFHLKSKIHPLSYVVAVVLGLLLYYVTIGVSLMFQNVLILVGFTHITTAAGTIFSSPEVLVMELITVALLPGIFEELTNRGLLMSVFEHEKNETTVIVIMAVIFALFHQNITQTGYTFVGGLVLAFLAIKTKSVFPGMIVHFINNGLSVLFSYADQKGLALATFRNMVFDTNIFLLFGSWIITGFVIVFLLKFIARLNSTPPQFSYSEAAPLRHDKVESLFAFRPRESLDLAKLKPSLSDYGFIIAACALSFFTTLFTFIWGIWR